MANREHVTLIEQGAAVWNQWRRDHPEVRPDLYAAHLSSTDLSGMNLASGGQATCDVSDPTHEWHQILTSGLVDQRKRALVLPNLNNS